MFLQTLGKQQIIVFHSLCPLHSHSSFLFAFFHPRRNERHFRKLNGLLWITSEPLVTPPLLPSLLQAPTSHPMSHPASPVPRPRGPCREVLRWEAASAFPRPFPDLLCSSAQRFLPYPLPQLQNWVAIQRSRALRRQLEMDGWGGSIFSPHFTPPQPA